MFAAGISAQSFTLLVFYYMVIPSCLAFNKRTQLFCVHSTTREIDKIPTLGFVQPALNDKSKCTQYSDILIFLLVYRSHDTFVNCLIICITPCVETEQIGI